MLQVLTPTPQKDQLTALTQAISIARDIYGIRGDMAKFDEYKKNAEAADLKRKQEEQKAIDLQQGNLDPMQSAELAQKGSFVPADKGQGVGLFNKVPGLTGPQKFVPKENKFEDLMKEIQAQNLIDAPNKEKEKIQREDVKDLITKREKVDSTFSPFERLYGSISSLEEKYIKGDLNPQDRVQLVRLIVPLTEISPGVVRSEEVNLVNEQQSLVGRILTKYGKETTGEGISDQVVKDIFNTTKSLKPVVANMKYDALSNIKNQADEFGVNHKEKVIFGDKNLLLLTDPNKFANFQNKSTSGSQAGSKTPAGDVKIKTEELSLDQLMAEKQKRSSLTNTQSSGAGRRAN